jgi:hypothetical protein
MPKRPPLRRHPPSLSPRVSSFFNERASLEVMAILGDEVRKDGAGVEEDPSHGFVA